MSDVTIRPAGLADIPTITRIYAHAVRNGTANKRAVSDGR